MTTMHPFFYIHDFSTWIRCGMETTREELIKYSKRSGGGSHLFELYRMVCAIFGGFALGEANGSVGVNSPEFNRWLEKGRDNPMTLEVFAAAAKNLTTLPYNFRPEDEDREVGWLEVLDFIGTLPLQTQYEAAMKVDPDKESGVWLIGQTLLKLEKATELNPIARAFMLQALMKRLVGAMTFANAGQVFAWVANATQPKSVFDPHPFNGTEIETELTQRLRDCSWDVAEVVPSERWGRREHHTPLCARMLSSDRRTITWVHRGPRVNVQPGMFVALPTSEIKGMGGRSQFRDGSITTVDVDFTPYMLYRPDRVRNETMTTVVKFHLITVEPDQWVSDTEPPLSIRLINENGIPVIVINGYGPDSFRWLNVNEFKRRVGLEVGDPQRIMPSGRRSVRLSFYDFVSAQHETSIAGYLVSALLHAHRSDTAMRSSQTTNFCTLQIRDLQKLNGSTVVLRRMGFSDIAVSVQDGQISGFGTTVRAY